MMDSYKGPPQHVIYDTDADGSEQRYVIWRKVFKAYCMKHKCSTPIDKTLNQYKADNPTTTTRTADDVEREWNEMNEQLYANLLMCVTGKQLENVVLSDRVNEGDGRAAMKALEDKNKGTAIVDILRIIADLFRGPLLDEDLVEPVLVR